MIEVIFGVAEYDQPKVYEAGFIPRSLLRNEKEFYRLDTPQLAAVSFINGYGGQGLDGSGAMGGG